MGFVIARKTNYSTPTVGSVDRSTHVTFAMWVDGNQLRAQVNNGKIHVVTVKHNNWEAANVFMCTQIPEIKQYIDELKRRPF